MYSEEAESVFNLDKLLGKHFEVGAELGGFRTPPTLPQGFGHLTGQMIPPYCIIL